MPSVPDLDKHMEVWAEEWSLGHGFQNYFGALWNSVHAYYRAADHRIHPQLNFEKVFGEMMALSHWMTPAPWGDTLRQTACEGTSPPKLNFPLHPFGDVAPYSATVTVMDQLNCLLGKLAKHMRVKSQELDSETDAAWQYRTIIDGLRESFEVGIYNLNYDNAAPAA